MTVLIPDANSRSRIELLVFLPLSLLAHVYHCGVALGGG